MTLFGDVGDESETTAPPSSSAESTVQAPYLLFLGDVTERGAAKTASGILDWRPERCLGQRRLAGCTVDLGLPEISPREAAALGARTLVVGVVNAGGAVAPEWIPLLKEALEAGLDLAAGLHQRLSDIPELARLAAREGRRLWDVRHPDRTFPTGTGVRRSGKRVLTVGTDCVVGKKYAALALEKALKARGVNAEFRATGQTGILIAGCGVAVDAVVADFVAGAAEWLSPSNSPDHWDVIEGQGSLFHPAYAGVTLGLIHGSQPDALVFCHEPGRSRLGSVDYPVPELMGFIDANLAAARLTNPQVIGAGMSLNTSRLTDREADLEIARIEDLTGLPACDPLRDGASKIADHLIKVLG